CCCWCVRSGCPTTWTWRPCSRGCRGRTGCPTRAPGPGSRTVSWCGTTTTAARCASATGRRTRCYGRRRCCAVNCGRCSRTPGQSASRFRESNSRKGLLAMDTCVHAARARRRLAAVVLLTCVALWPAPVRGQDQALTPAERKQLEADARRLDQEAR